MGEFLKQHGASDDNRIRQALSDVPVPAGLAERLHAALKNQTTTGTESDLDARRVGHSSAQIDLLGDACELVTESRTTHELDLKTQLDSSENLAPGENKRQRRGDVLRRSLLVLACACALAGFAYLTSRWQQPLERNWLVAHSQFILEQWGKQNPARLQNDGFALSSHVQKQLVGVKIAGTIPLGSIGSKLSGTLYRLDAHDGRGIVLLKLTNSPAIRGLSNRFTPLSSPSGGWSLAAMTINNETFVLAAVGTEQQLFAYIHSAAVT